MHQTTKFRKLIAASALALLSVAAPRQLSAGVAISITIAPPALLSTLSHPVLHLAIFGVQDIGPGARLGITGYLVSGSNLLGLAYCGLPDIGPLVAATTCGTRDSGAPM